MAKKIKQIDVINPNEYGGLCIGKEEINAVKNVLKNKKIFRYAEEKTSTVDLFEDKIKDRLNCKYALGITSGTSALKVALFAVGVEKGDRVLVSSYTFLATALSVISLGAIPIPIDIDFENGLDLNTVNEEIIRGAKAIICVHFQGRTFNLNKLKNIAKSKNIPLIEDACQAFGSKYKNTYAGCFGDIGVYSFQQYKQITCGEGGCLVTNSIKYYEKARNYSDMGSVRDLFPSWNDKNAILGENYRMNNIQAAILIEQLNKLDKIIENQKKNNKYLLEQLNGKIRNILYSQDSDGDTGMNILIFVNNKLTAETIINEAKKMNVEVRKMWGGLYYNNELFKREKLIPTELGCKECNNTQNIIERLLVIPISPKLNKSDIRQIGIVFSKIIEKNIIE